MLLNRVLNIFTSLRLTVICLSAAMVLVFVGTLAQVKLGLWDAQTNYFHSFLVFWTVPGTSLSLPVWPGGYLIGSVLLVNLIAAHIKRFEFSKKKAGIFLIHVGLIMLLIGQLLTELAQVESSLRFEEGQAKNYSESNRHNELAVIDVTDAKFDEVVAFPDSQVMAKGELRHPKLPFTIRVKEFFENSDPELVAPMVNTNSVRATHGAGRRVTFRPVAVTKKMDENNFPAAQIEVVTDQGVQSTWMVSSWYSIEQLAAMIQRQWGQMLGGALDEPQQFTQAGRTYQIAFRPTRYYVAHRVQLLDFRHDKYQGTDKPKNFSSQVRVLHPTTGEDREVLIKMNSPLRYAGLTYYQGSFDPRNDRVSIIHVVRNPAWLTPYLACTIISAGLLAQFLTHLIGFIRRRAAKPAVAASGAKINSPKRPGHAPVALATERRKA